MKNIFKILLLVTLIAPVYGCYKEYKAGVYEQPVAIAGDDISAIIDIPTALDGSASYDPLEQELSYDWQVVLWPDNAKYKIYNNSIEQPSFWAKTPGQYVMSLKVSAGGRESELDYVNIKVLDAISDVSERTIKIENAGSYCPDEKVTLDAAAYISDWSAIDQATIQWTQESGMGVRLDNVNSQVLEFIAPYVGTATVHTFVFTAAYKSGEKVKLTLDIIVAPTVVRINPLEAVKVGDIFVLDGSASCFTASNIEYQWNQLSPLSPQLPMAAATTASTTVEATASGLYYFELRLNNKYSAAIEVLVE